MAKAPLPKHARAEMEREFERWKLVTAQIKEVTDLMKCSIKDGKGQAAEQARRLGSLRGIGLIGSYVLTHEMFSWREFHNRKEVGAYVGLTGTPYNSGESEKDQGISKAGNKRVRRLINELAWLWIRYQPQSPLTRWFIEKVGAGGKRARRVAVIALARKLLVVLWHFAVDGIPPKDVVMSA